MIKPRRRDLLKLGLLVPLAAAAAPFDHPRRLRLRGADGGTELELVYRRGNDYDAGALARITALLRDDQQAGLPPFDPRLLDCLYDAAALHGVEASYVVISAYRGEQAAGARHGLHAQGRAIDVRLDGVECAELAARAGALSRGGVGCYRRARFVHLDSGAPRIWRG